MTNNNSTCLRANAHRQGLRQAGKIEQFEKTLFRAADKLRKNMSAANYKDVVLGLIFIKYISDSFEEVYRKIINKEKGFEDANPEDIDEYRAENVFFVPQTARWSYLLSSAKLPSIGKDIDDAMEAIEKENASLKGILPKIYALPNLHKPSLGELLDLVGRIALGDEASKSKDILGRVYEYFLGEFASLEGKKGGQFYTPKSIVQLMVEMIEPYHGRIFDPACGSGGMFIMSEKFVENHKGIIDDIAIYGQESNAETWKLCRMNLAIRGIDGSQVRWNTEGSFLNDLHKDLKADFVLANPPFNDSGWSGQLLQNDPRWQYGMPPASNANYAWLQHMIYHLSPKGVMACVLANGSLSSQTNNEGEIRKTLVENDLVDCIVALPKQLFYNTGIPACIWFISRKRAGNGDLPAPLAIRQAGRKRTGEILFIDASEVGFMADRTHREFTEEDIAKISETYHEWRKRDGKYEDIKGFCKSANIEEITKHNFVLTPGRYVGIKDEVDDLPAPRPNTYYVYAIKCDDQSIYIGQTEDLRKRWQEHLSGTASDWTKKHKPRMIVHHEIFSIREEAVNREKELKTGFGRKWLQREIAAGRARQAGGIPFEEKIAGLTKTLAEQMKEEKKLDEEIKKQLKNVGFNLNI